MTVAQQLVQSAVTATPSRRSRFFAHPLVRIAAGIALVVASMALAMLLSETVPKPMRAGWPLLLAAVACVLGYRLFVRLFEKRDIPELATAGAVRELGKGLGLGAALGLGVAGVLAAAGAFSVAGSNGWDLLFKPLPEQIMVAFLEEILFRAVLFRIVEQRWGSRTALIVSFVAFALAHLPNENVSVLGIFITGVAGVALSASYMLTRRLWLPIGVHFGWNYLYDGVFAVPVSGHAARGLLQVSMPGPEWLTGGAYGVEASAVTLVVWSAAAVFLLRRALRR
jgi:membrane protease YdiL (CAAX protease family)